MRSLGLIKGGSLDSAIVIDDFKIINEGGLRYDDEFVRHKMLDTLGDISLLGMPVIGQLDTHKSGHALNHELTKEILANPKSWKVVQVEEKSSQRLMFKIPQWQGMESSVS